MGSNANARRNKAIAGMVLGILSLVLMVVPTVGALLALVGVVLSGMALNAADDACTNDGRGMAIAGLVTGIVGLVVGLPYTFGVSCLCALLPGITVL